MNKTENKNSASKPINTSQEKRSLSRLASVQQLYACLLTNIKFDEDELLKNCAEVIIGEEKDARVKCNANFCKNLCVMAFKNRIKYKKLSIQKYRNRDTELLIQSILYIALAEHELRKDLNLGIIVSEYSKLFLAFCNESELGLFQSLLNQCLRKLDPTGKKL